MTYTTAKTAHAMPMTVMEEVMTMKNDKQFEDVLKRIGKVAEVGEDWYEIGEAEKGEDGETRYGIYAKTDEIAEKVGKVFDRIIADKGGDSE